MDERSLPEMYRHWKGGYYLLVRIGIHHDTEERWAIYRPIDGDESVLFIRPLSEFEDTVRDVQDVEVPRFRIVTPEEGEQVAINRLRQQFERAREEAEGDPEAQIALGMTETVLNQLQERLNSRLSGGSQETPQNG